VLHDLRRVLLVIGAVAALTGTGVACSSDAPSCKSYTATDTVELKDFSFDPACVGASPGASLTLRDVGSAPHSFTVKGTGVNVQVDPGQTATADLSGVAPGTYTVICTYHPDMVGRLKVG
jgi:plastocyanin